MKKGTFFTNLFLLISVCCMYAIVLFMGYMDISTYISIGTLTVLSLILFISSFCGLNRISQITGCLKKFRKNVLKLHVKDPECVWETLCEEKYVFKNSILDGEFNNFKKEMDRLEDEGAIYCQPDISDYVNENIIFTGVKKRLLDSVATCMTLIGIAGILLSVAHMLGIIRYDLSTKVVVQCIKPIIVMALYVLFLIGMYTYIYKILITNVCQEYRLFIGDFYKYVVPCAKNDMANNIVYLQQIQMQNNEKLSENVVEILSEKINETMIRQSEKFSDLSRQIENMNCILNRFNEGMDSLDITIKDMMENDRVLSKEQIKTLRNCVDRMDKSQLVLASIDADKPELVKETEKVAEVDKVDEAEKATEADKVDEAEKAAEVDKVDEIEKAAETEKVEEKEVKKTTRKRATTKKGTTTKKTTTKKTTAKKTTAKKTTKKDVEDKNEDVNTEENKVEENKIEESKAEDNKEQVAVEITPVKKKRGRKSKAEKEAELQAALEIAKQEMAKRAQEEVKEEEATVEEPVETKVEEATVEEPVETKAEETTVEEPVETKAEEITVEELVETKIEEATVEEPVDTKVEETTVEEINNVIAFRKEEKIVDNAVDEVSINKDTDTIEVLEVEI